MKLHHVGIRRPVNGLSAIMIEEILGQKSTKKLLVEENKFDDALEEQFLTITNYCRGLSYNILGKDRMDTNPEFVFNYDVTK